MNLNDLEALTFAVGTDASELYNILNTLKGSLLGWGQENHDNLGHNLLMQGTTAQRPTSADFELPEDGGDFCLAYWSTDELLLYIYDGEQWRNAGRTEAEDVSYTTTGYDTIDNVALALDQLFTLVGSISTDAESILYEFSASKYLLGTSGNVETGMGLLADWAEGIATTVDSLETTVNTLSGNYGDLTGTDGASAVGLDSTALSNITASNLHDAIAQIDNLFDLTGLTSASNITYNGTSYLAGVGNVSVALNTIEASLNDFPDCTLLDAHEPSTVAVGLIKKFVMPQVGLVGIGYAHASGAPTGADLIVQVRLNNAPMIDITIAAGDNTGYDDAAQFGVVAGDVVQIYVSQVGSGAAGSNLAVGVQYRITRDL